LVFSSSSALSGANRRQEKEGLSQEYGKVVISNYSANHEDVVYDILDRKADVGAVKSTILVRPAAEDRKVAKRLFILSRTPPVPESRPARPQRIARRVDQDRVAEHA